MSGSLALQVWGQGCGAFWRRVGLKTWRWLSLLSSSAAQNQSIISNFYQLSTTTQWIFEAEIAKVITVRRALSNAFKSFPKFECNFFSYKLYGDQFFFTPVEHFSKDFSTATNDKAG